MLKLKTSQQPQKSTTKDTKKAVQKEAPKIVKSQDIDEDQDETNLIEVKKVEKKSTQKNHQQNDGWQQQEDNKELLTNGIGKKATNAKKIQEEAAIDIKNEEFPDLSIAAESHQTKKQQKQQQQQNQQQQNQQKSDSKQIGGSMFTNSNGGTSTFTNSNSKPQQQPSLNVNSGPLSFTNTKKDENAVKFQQKQQEELSKVHLPPQVEETQAPKVEKQTVAAPPPVRNMNIFRNSNQVQQQPTQQLNILNDTPSFTNSKAKGNLPVQQTQQPALVEQQEQNQKEEDEEDWEVVEPKKKNHTVNMQRNKNK